MEEKSVQISHAPGAHETNMRVEATESNQNVAKDVPNSSGNHKQINTFERGGDETFTQEAPVAEDKSVDVNLEASITTDDVIQAGGFGARDDISSFLPVASDLTDFEETILDARNYEEPQQEVQRHGLGWRDSLEGK